MNTCVYTNTSQHEIYPAPGELDMCLMWEERKAQLEGERRRSIVHRTPIVFEFPLCMNWFIDISILRIFTSVFSICRVDWKLQNVALYMYVFQKDYRVSTSLITTHISRRCICSVWFYSKSKKPKLLKMTHQFGAKTCVGKDYLWYLSQMPNKYHAQAST